MTVAAGGRRVRFGPLFVATAAAAATIPAADNAQAADASRVVLLRPAGDDPLSRQGTTLLKAELQAVGFEVTEVEVDAAGNRNGTSGRDLRRHIENVSARLQPVATFAIQSIPGGTTMELWLEDRLTGKLVIRRVDVTAGADGASDLAVKAMELLRGSLMEVTVRRSTGQVTPPPTPPDVRRFVAAGERREFFADGVGISAGAIALRDLAAAAGYAPVLRIFWGRADGYAVRFAASGLGTAPQLQAVEGSASVNRSLFLAEGIRTFRPGARLQPFAGAAAGIYRVSSTGEGISSLFPEGSETTHAVAAGAQTGIAARLGSRLALVVDLALLASTPRTSIKIASRDLARTGGLTGLLSASFSGTF